MNELDRDTVYEFALEGIDYTGFKVKAAFKDIPSHMKLSAFKILNLDTLRWYKNRLVNIHDPACMIASDKEIIMYNNFEAYDLPSLLKLDRMYQEEEKLRSM